jgi:lactate dehydrogenase-like 2-hydroxyacid dehydrogenase
MLATARRLTEVESYVRNGDWTGWRLKQWLGVDVHHATLGIIGMGRIGQAIAKRAAAFDMSIAYTARNARPQLPWAHLPSVQALAEQVDFLVVITPGGAATRHLIDASALAALGRSSAQGGILINVARGSVVDEAALIDALERGVIAGAGLDVFENEPQVPERLRALPQVVLAPHIGSATAQTRQAMADLAFANLRAFFSDQPLPSAVPECR